MLSVFFVLLQKQKEAKYERIIKMGMDNNTHHSFHRTGNSYYYATGLSSIHYLCIRKWRVEEKVLN